MVEMGLQLLQTGFVAGVFWRMGGFNATLDALKEKVTKLERKLENA